METIPPFIWLIAVTVGVVLLGGAMIYGTMRNRQRTVTEKIVTEVETKRNYEREDKDPT